MNRRNFLNNLIVAGASFTILPGAGRIWRAVAKPEFTCELIPTLADGSVLPMMTVLVNYGEPFRDAITKAIPDWQEVSMWRFYGKNLTWARVFEKYKIEV